MFGADAGRDGRDPEQAKMRRRCSSVTAIPPRVGRAKMRFERERSSARAMIGAHVLVDRVRDPQPFATANAAHPECGACMCKLS